MSSTRCANKLMLMNGFIRPAMFLLRRRHMSRQHFGANEHNGNGGSESAGGIFPGRPELGHQYWKTSDRCNWPDLAAGEVLEAL